MTDMTPVLYENAKMLARKTERDIANARRTADEILRKWNERPETDPTRAGR